MVSTLERGRWSLVGTYMERQQYSGVSDDEEDDDDGGSDGYLLDE